MDTPSKFELDFLADVRMHASRYGFYPRGTVRCTGVPCFRSQAARDLGCLLDLDPNVDTWNCLPLTLTDQCDVHVPDFAVYRDGKILLMDVLTSDRPSVASFVEDAARRNGYLHCAIDILKIGEGPRILNARDLLRYAKTQCALGDRIRLLAALEEHGSMPLIECLSAFQETRPVAGLAALVLGRFVSMELDEERIGPSTTVSRIA